MRAKKKKIRVLLPLIGLIASTALFFLFFDEYVKYLGVFSFYRVAGVSIAGSVISSYSLFYSIVLAMDLAAIALSTFMVLRAAKSRDWIG